MTISAKLVLKERKQTNAMTGILIEESSSNDSHTIHMELVYLPTNCIFYTMNKSTIHVVQ